MTSGGNFIDTAKTIDNVAGSVLDTASVGLTSIPGPVSQSAQAMLVAGDIGNRGTRWVSQKIGDKLGWDTSNVQNQQDPSFTRQALQAANYANPLIAPGYAAFEIARNLRQSYNTTKLQKRNVNNIKRSPYPEENAYAMSPSPYAMAQSQSYTMEPQSYAMPPSPYATTATQRYDGSKDGKNCILRYENFIRFAITLAIILIIVGAVLLVSRKIISCKYDTFCIMHSNQRNTAKSRQVY